MIALMIALMRGLRNAAIRRFPLVVVVVFATLVAPTLSPAGWAFGDEGGDRAAGHGHEVKPEGSHEAGGHEGDAHEGGEHAPAIDGKKLALQFLNFGALVFILVWFGGRAINKSLAARHQQLKADLATAAELRAAAEAKLAKQDARLASLEHEIADMRRGLKAEAGAEKERLIAAAEERARRIKAETGFLVEQQVREAEQRLRRESANAALTVAEEILRRSIGATDQQQLLDTFVGDVERAAPAAPEPGRAV